MKLTEPLYYLFAPIIIQIVSFLTQDHPISLQVANVLSYAQGEADSCFLLLYRLLVTTVFTLVLNKIVTAGHLAVSSLKELNSFIFINKSIYLNFKCTDIYKQHTRCVYILNISRLKDKRVLYKHLYRVFIIFFLQTRKKSQRTLRV